jgi:hypothetical protein
MIVGMAGDAQSVKDSALHRLPDVPRELLDHHAVLAMIGKGSHRVNRCSPKGFGRWPRVRDDVPGVVARESTARIMSGNARSSQVLRRWWGFIRSPAAWIIVLT